MDQQLLFRNICIYTNTYVPIIPINEKIADELEGEQEGVHEKEERKGKKKFYN